MDISLPTSWGQEICIPGNAIPNIQIDGVNIVRETVQGKLCYTLQVSGIPSFDTLKELYLQSGWRQFLSALLEEKIYAELSRFSEKAWLGSRQEFWILWKKYFPNGYDEKRLQGYLLELRSRYGDKIAHLETEIKDSKTLAQTFYRDLLQEYESRSGNISAWNKQKFWQDLALLLINKVSSGTNSFTDFSHINPKSLVDEAILIRQDPKQRRWVAQGALSGTFNLLRKAGIEPGITSVWGTNRADGAFVFKVPAGLNQSSPYIILWQWNSVTSTSLQEWLDQYALKILRPVFTQYLVNPNGEIEGEVRTHLTDWTEKILFPSNALLRDWIYQPDLLPKNAEILLYSRNGGSGVTLTKMTPKWWFLSMGINQETYKGIEAKAEHFTLWYLDTSGDLRGNIALTGSQVQFSHGDPDQKTTNTGVSIVGNWEWRVIQYGQLKVGTRGHLNISAQTGEKWTIDYTQTARIWLDTHHFLQYQLSPKLQGEIWFWYDRLWSPNLFPNTFYKLSNSERHLTRFQTWMNINAGLRYKIPGGEISTTIWKQTGHIMDTTIARVDYALAQYRIEYIQKHWKSKHPLLDDQRSEWITLHHQSHGIGIQWWMHISKIWGIQNKEIHLWGSVQF